MQQTASVLMNAVHHQCPEQIYFNIGDTLVGRNFGVYNRGRPWHQIVQQVDPDIVLLGAGAHIPGNASNYQIVMEEVYEGFKEEYGHSDKLLIWKTMNHGGIASLGMLDRIPDLNDPDTLDLWVSKGYKPEWGWNVYPEYDLMAKKYFRSKGVPVLDVEPLSYRSDNHPGSDLHHCAHGDGALRLIPRLLQSLLLEVDMMPEM